MKDVLESLFPEDIQARLKSDRERMRLNECTVTVKCYIGDKDFEWFIAEIDRNGYTSLAVKNLEL
jgi:hypothetical protein